MSIPSEIFKSYDIRGLVASQLSPELAHKLGRAYVQFVRNQGNSLEGKSIVVGMDMRPSSVQFEQEVVRGITDEGVDAVTIGLCSTPLFNYACTSDERYAAGIIVTASHNPAEYNGFKMTLGDGRPIGKGSGMEEIQALVQGDMDEPHGEKGSVSAFDPLPGYTEKIFSLVSPETIGKLKIVIDAGNGMAKSTFPHVLASLPVVVEYLYLEPDGTFPNHEANPLKEETLSELKKKVVEVGADFGFALDGDGDRIGLIDEKGEMVDPSFVGALLGLELLREHDNSHMLYDLRTSMVARDVWEAAGATTDKSMVGHANIKRQMREQGALFASELSLHLYFASMHYLESSDLSLLYFLHLLTREQKPLSELVAPLKKYVHSGEHNFEVEDKDAVMQRIEDALKKEATEVSHLDGVWMSFGWGWVSIRKSNTEPVLRLNLEAKDEETMKEKLRVFSQLIED